MGMTCDEITEFITRDRLAEPMVKVVMDRVPAEKLAKAFGVTLEVALQVQSDLGFLYRQRA